MLTGGVSGGAGLGISVPDQINSFSDLLDTQIFVKVQANGLVGSGLYAGVGVDLGVGSSDGPLPVGASEQSIAVHVEGNVGWGAAVGLSADFAKGGSSVDGLQNLGQRPPASMKAGKAGAGFGIMAAGGVSTTTTIATPSIGEMYKAAKDYLFGE